MIKIRFEKHFLLVINPNKSECVNQHESTNNYIYKDKVDGD